MTKDIIKQALSEAEKDAQQKEINRIKEIVTSYLSKIKECDDNIREWNDKRKVLKQDLEDLKSGRLDKIEERQIKDKKSRDISLILVKKVEKEFVPMYPWRSPWVIEWRTPSSGFKPGTWLTTGTSCTNFAGGTYVVQGSTYTV